MIPQRLVFIDVARCIAILLMLEGHFISSLLDPSYINHNHWAYITWSSVRTITAPLFLTISGLIFSFLLCTPTAHVRKNNPRIKKGLLRSGMLFLWGIVLHLSIRQFNAYANGVFSEWIFSFHILQCLSVGLIVIIAVYAFHKKVGGISLAMYLLILSTLLISLYPFLASLSSTEFYPTWAHAIIQNALKGPNSIFPIVPWISFMLYGAVIGSMLSAKRELSTGWKLPVTLILIGLFLRFGLNHLLYAFDVHFDEVLTEGIYALDVAHIYNRLGTVLIILACLMILLKKVEIKENNLMLRVGQQTLMIYIVHCILLYGALAGYGLDTYFHHSLTPWQAILGAIGFLGFFILLTLVVEKKNVLLGRIRRN